MNELDHFDLARPTLSASQLMRPEIRRIHLLSDSFGVRVATRDAVAITLAAICRIWSAFSVMYWIILVGGLLHQVGCLVSVVGTEKDSGFCGSTVGIELVLKKLLARNPMEIGPL